MTQGRPKVYRGIGASPGVAIGTVFLLERGKVRVPNRHVEPDQIAAEQARLRRAIATSIEQVASLRPKMTAGQAPEHLSILDAHEMMLRDTAMHDEALGLIAAEQINAEWAVNQVIARLRGLFDQLGDSYLRERQNDIDFTGERILRNLGGAAVDLPLPAEPGEDAIIVARDLSPVDTTLLTRHKVCAFVTEIGGKTSHTSIIARSMDVPAVVGVQGILQTAGSGDVIVVDGLDGTVMLRPSRAQLSRGHRRAKRFHQFNLSLLEAKALPARTSDGFVVQVAGNIELPREVTGVVDRGGESIGLYRTEYMFLARTDLPDEDEHYRTYRNLIAHLGERELTVRTFDLGGDKIMGPAHVQGPEPNPALGLRAIRLCLANEALFTTQLAGLLRAAVHGNLRIMLPMISGLEELLAAKALLAQVAARLRREGKPHRADVPVGIMVEVPSAVLCADALCAHADFVSIGTNDLMQYLLAIDRTNERVAYLYRPLHPAMLRCLTTVIGAAKRADISVSICGEMAGDSDYTPIFVGLGVTQLSMNAGSIPRIKRFVRELSQAACAELVQQTLAASGVDETERLVQAFVDKRSAYMGALLA